MGKWTEPILTKLKGTYTAQKLLIHLWRILVLVWLNQIVIPKQIALIMALNQRKQEDAS